jgi:outer membrane biosynthesis protein TonB
MAERKQIPDIMGGLLGGKAKPPEQPAPPPAPAGQPAESERTEPEQPAGKPAKQRASRPVKPAPTRKPAKAPAPPEAEEKIKATFYLSQDIVDALEDAWLQLRRLASDRSSVSKSLIVETALEIALEELTKKGDKSALASRMADL